MPISQRKFRALVFEYRDAGSAGQVDSTYLLKSSGDADDMWWCSRSEVGGQEVTTGMQPDHRVDAVFGFAAACSLAVNDAIYCQGASYQVRAILPKEYGTNENQVLVERTTELRLTMA